MSMDILGMRKRGRRLNPVAEQALVSMVTEPPPGKKFSGSSSNTEGGIGRPPINYNHYSKVCGLHMSNPPLKTQLGGRVGLGLEAVLLLHVYSGSCWGSSPAFHRLLSACLVVGVGSLSHLYCCSLLKLCHHEFQDRAAARDVNGDPPVS